MSGSIGLGLVALAVGLAPVPADPPPDPLAWGYLGVQVDPGTLRINERDCKRATSSSGSGSCGRKPSTRWPSISAPSVPAAP
jgi:hypothetical protein